MAAKESRCDAVRAGPGGARRTAFGASSQRLRQPRRMAVTAGAPPLAGTGRHEIRSSMAINAWSPPKFLQDPLSQTPITALAAGAPLPGWEGRQPLALPRVE